MLDYRAHKLFLILFGIPFFILRWVTIIALPFVYLSIGISLAETRILQIGISLLVLFPIEMIWSVVMSYIDKMFMYIFNLFIDVLPADGRTKDESIFVVRGGERAIKALEISNVHPSKWKDEFEDFYGNDFFSMFFKEKISERFHMVRDYYSKNKSLPYNSYALKKLLKSKKMEQSFVELVLTNPTYRGWAVSYTLTLYLLLFNPFAR